MSELVLTRRTVALLKPPRGLRAVMARGMMGGRSEAVELVAVPVLALAVQTVGYEDRARGEDERTVGIVAGDGDWNESGEVLKAADDELEFFCYLNPGQEIGSEHLIRAIGMRVERLQHTEMDVAIDENDVSVLIRRAEF